LRLIRTGDVNNPGAFTYSETGLCTYPGCGEPHKAKGYCALHYQRFRKGTLGLPETLTCERCGREFPRPYKKDPAKVRYCSHECRYAVQLDDHRANRAERGAYLKEWAARNPEKQAAIWARVDARRRNAHVFRVTGKDIARLARRYRGMCAYCGIRPYEHLDHVVPLIRGGVHSIGNLLPACAPCNLTKGPRLLADWRHRPPLPKRFRRSVGFAVAARPVA
jgi:5-methylcytosine-specific restriction endonuclease McrA